MLQNAETQHYGLITWAFIKESIKYDGALSKPPHSTVDENKPSTPFPSKTPTA
jgi:hypothetical protein